MNRYKGRLTRCRHCISSWCFYHASLRILAGSDQSSNHFQRFSEPNLERRSAIKKKMMATLPFWNSGVMYPLIVTHHCLMLNPPSCCHGYRSGNRVSYDVVSDSTSSNCVRTAGLHNISWDGTDTWTCHLVWNADGIVCMDHRCIFHRRSTLSLWLEHRSSWR